MALADRTLKLFEKTTSTAAVTAIHVYQSVYIPDGAFLGGEHRPVDFGTVDFHSCLHTQ